ncbi:MAG: phasin family protein [Anaerolineae bacterium]|nr:MAG: phasin family protein [Anaerolineae bacterium]
MVEEVEVQEEIIEESGPNPLLEMTRKILYASIGAVALTQEEVEKFVNKLIERGEIAEKDGRKLIKDIMDKRRKKGEEVQADARQQVDGRMKDILDRMNIPSKSDIDALNEKITILTEKIDELQESES